MMTNIMMFGSLVALAMVQILEGAFLITIIEKKPQFTQARNHVLQIMVILVYAMNLKWLAGVDYSQRKKSEELKFTKSGIVWPCFACCSKRIHQIGIILVHCIDCLSTFRLIPRKLEKLKAWKNRNVPIYFFHSSVNTENCIGLRKNS